MAQFAPAGRRNRLISIEARSPSKDSAGQRVLTWLPFVASTWAHVEQLQGRELELAQAIVADASHRITIHYRPGITAGMRVRYQGRILPIAAPPIDPDTAHRSLVLLCTEGAAES